MRGARSWFNLLLVLSLASGLVSGAAESSDTSRKRSRKPKPVERIRVHVESRHDIAERSLKVEVGQGPGAMKFQVEKLPILNEVHVERAALLEVPGGFQVQLKFDSLGAKILESYTAAAAGRHLLLLTEFDEESRWIAAPLIRRRIGDGVLAFSPQITREEADRLVKGLNQAIDKRKKQWLD